MEIRRTFGSDFPLITTVFFCLVIQITSTARVTCIRLTSDHIADTTDLKRFRQFHEWKGKTGKEAQHQKRNAQRSAFLVLG